MGYRGDDLDLRTPQTWSTGPGPGEGYGAASRGRGYAAPIWVDEVVLAAANHAFEVALAHRAAEVRIEHLLYALTRIDAAAEVLEARGVRVASLRRESATVIASDIPVGLGNGKATPRRAEAFEEALRLAASEAFRRNAPASVGDLLDVFAEVRPDLPGLALLMRHTTARPAAYEPRYIEAPEPVRERIRMPAGSYYVGEAPRAARSELAATTADTIQNTRIEALEQMVRALSNDLASERKGMAQMLKDMQRDFVQSRDDTSRLGGGLAERLQSLEHLVVSSRSDGGAAPQLLDRLATVELAIEKRLSDLARTFSVVTDRLGIVEETLQGVRKTQGLSAADLGPVSDRISALERMIASGASDAVRQWSAVSDRLKAMEMASETRPDQKLDLTPIANRLDVIEEALLSQEGDITRELAERMTRVERLVQSQREEVVAETEVLKADVAKVFAAVTSQPAEAARLEAIAGIVDSGRAATVAAIAAPVMERVGQISSRLAAVETTLADANLALMLTQLSDRSAAVERALASSVQHAIESQKVYQQELTEVHEALVKLNTNQHTLAGSIDQWRTHGTSELQTMATRLVSVEAAAQKPVAMLEQMSASMEAMHRITVERYHRRNRFWYWLFGTDDWIGASWASQVAKIEAERAMVKTVKR